MRIGSALVVVVSLVALASCTASPAEPVIADIDVDTATPSDLSLWSSCLTATPNVTHSYVGGFGMYDGTPSPRAQCDHYIVELTNVVGDDLRVQGHDGLGLVLPHPVVLPSHCQQSGFHGRIYGYIPGHVDAAGNYMPPLWHALGETTQSGTWQPDLGRCWIDPAPGESILKVELTPSVYTKVRILTKTWYVGSDYVTRRAPSRSSYTVLH
jgi:hypothetical protein